MKAQPKTKSKTKRKWPRRKPSLKMLKAAGYYHARLDDTQREPAQKPLPWWAK